MNRNLPRVAMIPSPVLKNHYKKCTYLTRSHDCRCGDDVRRWVSLLCAAAAVKLVAKYVIIYAIYYDYYYLSFFVFFFQIIVIETRTVEHWYHTSPGSGILYIFRTSPTSSPPHVGLYLHRRRCWTFPEHVFPNWTRDTDDVIRRHWKRGDGGRVHECQGRHVSGFRVAAEFSRRRCGSTRAPWLQLRQ